MSEIRLGPVGHMEVLINCPTNAIPSAGQYLLACDLDDPNAFLANPLFLAEKTDQGFWAVPLFPAAWAPGGDLDLVGPLGHGFDLPRAIQRLALVALGETVARLMPLVHQKSTQHTAMTLFTDLSLPKLPAAVGVYTTSLMKDALD